MGKGDEEVAAWTYAHLLPSRQVADVIVRVAVAEGMSVMTVAGAVAVVVLMPLCTQTWRGASTLRWRRMSPAGSAMTVADVVVAVTVPAWRQTKGW